MPSTPNQALDVNSTLDVVIVDDAAEVRDLLRTYLELDERLRVVGEGASARDAAVLALACHPDVMVLDLEMPGGSGLDALPLVKQASPSTKVVVFSGEPASSTSAVAAEAGAAAYVTKTAPLSALTGLIIDLARPPAPRPHRITTKQ